jgi:thymidylate synthase ThyX
MYNCRILADSINAYGIRLTTFEVTFPRIILSEFNTHRVFSRNSSSSRAIPVEKMIGRVMSDPFIPFYWGQNQKGMSASTTIEHSGEAEKVWLETRDLVVGKVKELLELGVHKQITNRLLEPWMWQTVIVSATSWQNFFGLRTDVGAQPEIQKIAGMMRDEYTSHAPKLLQLGDWHLPLMADIEELRKKYNDLDLRKICAGRCCRVSYLTHNGVRDPEEDIRLCDQLMQNRHWSPTEHCAENMGDVKYYGNFVGWKQFRKFNMGEDVFAG